MTARPSRIRQIHTYAAVKLVHASVGDTDTWDNGILKYTAVRQPDSSDYINFTVTVTDTQDPALDALARTTCPS